MIERCTIDISALHSPLPLHWQSYTATISFLFLIPPLCFPYPSLSATAIHLPTYDFA